LKPLATHDRPQSGFTGNLVPAILPDRLAPIVRNGPEGERELAMARWGMRPSPQFGDGPITTIRNVKNRRIVPAA
jgi:putative SOS response-associated peptidase YedK